ncbi:MAG TPA: thioredoxin family protein [Rhabdaerophilum sp.]|nr:thioredoxin family protein [Rhabdaerophilum sp.]
MNTRSNLSPTRRVVLGAVTALAFAGIAAPALSLASGFTTYTKPAFDAALKGSKPVLVHVHAEWCPVCKKQEAVFNELSGSADFKKLAAFVVDFDKEADFKKAHGVNNQSVILVFKGGKEVARSGGVTDKAKIAELVAGAAK